VAIFYNLPQVTQPKSPNVSKRIDYWLKVSKIPVNESWLNLETQIPSEELNLILPTFQLPFIGLISRRFFMVMK
jgi:hypothetical protein